MGVLFLWLNGHYLLTLPGKNLGFRSSPLNESSNCANQQPGLIYFCLRKRSVYACYCDFIGWHFTGCYTIENGEKVLPSSFKLFIVMNPVPAVDLTITCNVFCDTVYGSEIDIICSSFCFPEQHNMLTDINRIKILLPRFFHDWYHRYYTYIDRRFKPTFSSIVVRHCSLSLIF